MKMRNFYDRRKGAVEGLDLLMSFLPWYMIVAIGLSAIAYLSPVVAMERAMSAAIRAAMTSLSPSIICAQTSSIIERSLRYSDMFEYKVIIGQSRIGTNNLTEIEIKNKVDISYMPGFTSFDENHVLRYKVASNHFNARHDSGYSGAITPNCAIASQGNTWR